MRNLKVIVISAGCGLVLSLFFGIFSHAGFLRILLRGVISALFFALLAFLIQLVFTKFLDEAGPVDSDISGGAPVAATGHSVNLVISDTELEDTGGLNRYKVGHNRQMLNDSDINQTSAFRASAVYEKAAAPSASEAAVNASDKEKGGFVPVTNVETLSNFSGTEAVASKPAAQTASAPSAAPESVSGGSENELDVLPDMSGFSFGEESSPSEIHQDTLAESSFDPPASSRIHNEQQDVDVSDAPLIAKAISSILSEET